MWPEESARRYRATGVLATTGLSKNSRKNLRALLLARAAAKTADAATVKKG